MLMLAFLAVLVFALVNGARLMRRLQVAHPSVWSSLGRPTVTLSTGIRPRLALVRFVWSLRFRELADPQLSFTCWAAMAAEPLLAVLFVLLVIA